MIKPADLCVDWWEREKNHAFVDEILPDILAVQYIICNFARRNQAVCAYVERVRHKEKYKNKIIEMSRICQITGKRAMRGNNVAHSKLRTKRVFDVNLFSKKFYYPEEDCWISLTISAAGLRLINKIGLDAALRQAVEKGYCNPNNIKVLA